MPYLGPNSHRESRPFLALYKLFYEAAETSATEFNEALYDDSTLQLIRDKGR